MENDIYFYVCHSEIYLTQFNLSQPRHKTLQTEKANVKVSDHQSVLPTLSNIKFISANLLTLYCLKKKINFCPQNKKQSW